MKVIELKKITSMNGKPKNMYWALIEKIVGYHWIRIKKIEYDIYLKKASK